MSEINKVLKKALHQAISKAMETAPAKQAAQAVVRDVLDPNDTKQVPEEALPPSAESVLNKKNDIKAMHDQKEARARAAVGLRPGESGTNGVARLRKFLADRPAKKPKSL
jgi:hypothetical protein